MAFMSYEPASSSFAWKASSFENPADYLVELTGGDRGEMIAAIDTLERNGRLVPVQALTKSDFRFDGLHNKLERGYAEVRSGKGFVVLRGLPFEGLSLEQFTACAWGVGLHFGRALSQNAQGELVTSVVDATAEDATPRMYRSNLELRPHSDITAMISLACWHKSASGGASIIVSGVTVHDEIRARAPHLLEALYRGYHYHRLGEEGPGEDAATPYRTPVFANRNGQLSCRYQRAGIAARQREPGVALRERDLRFQEALPRRSGRDRRGARPQSERRRGRARALRRHAPSDPNPCVCDAPAARGCRPAISQQGRAADGAVSSRRRDRHYRAPR